MPQFAIYANPGRAPNVLFVVQIQTTRLDGVRDRVVIPLLRRGSSPPPDHDLTPHMTVLDQTVYADPLNLATIQFNRLGAPLGILPEADQGRIITAIGEMLSRA